jgi:hypothetical protein
MTASSVTPSSIKSSTECHAIHPEHAVIQGLLHCLRGEVHRCDEHKLVRAHTRCLLLQKRQVKDSGTHSRHRQRKQTTQDHKPGASPAGDVMLNAHSQAAAHSCRPAQSSAITQLGHTAVQTHAGLLPEVPHTTEQAQVRGIQGCAQIATYSNLLSTSRCDDSLAAGAAVAASCLCV